MKPRLPPVNVKGGLLNVAALRSTPYTIYCLSSFANFLGLYTRSSISFTTLADLQLNLSHAVLTYVHVSATKLGSTPELAFYYVSFANASSVFGRWAAGVLADRIGVPLPSLVCPASRIFPTPAQDR